ncbi:Myb-like DNA-binding domain containing protein [Trichomonas vaginalis G3]|uniref:Myb-like DNA-binding domain containing protein n=1 Tax=Trichomonas vaginalis (strain ATCC PRA-98 / G3) TaxID=412133 RepID=A2DAY0_TRIV3|nr:RNA polymerase II transcription regulator recruiting protein [Trichomonas vaginalis G3]EAY22310.1 Myb-like DNA-binding domain containing protein [Trichomonas vaginalis G3]KAI5518248.1 RNA polymerase II transcription regulator recruiting protein [Trichomonas vaginalis G3]|eukprot:XP_001583296.1 Myb-like DNA-binding domain containing protein [Trichomonas vaginalis G3]
MFDSSLNMYSQLLVGVPKNLMSHMQNLLYKFITNDLTYHQAASHCISLVGTSEPIDKIVMITNILESNVASSYYNPSGSFSLNGSENPNKKSKTWSKHDDQRLLAAIHKYGLLDWNKISEFVGNGRSRSQCVQRWSRSLNPLINKTQWTKEEDEKLLRMINKYGKRSWTKISSEIEGRTDVQCRYRYQILTKSEGKEQKSQKQISTAVPSAEHSPFGYNDYVSAPPCNVEAKPYTELETFVVQHDQPFDQQNRAFDFCSDIQLFNLLEEVSADPFSIFNM